MPMGDNNLTDELTQDTQSISNPFVEPKEIKWIQVSQGSTRAL